VVLQETRAEGYAAIPLFDSKGALLGMLGVISRLPFPNTQLVESLLKISAARAAAELERKRADEALRASEARLKVLFEYAPDPYYVNDLNGVILDANQAGEELTGFSRSEVLGRNIMEAGLLAPEDLPKAMNRASRATAGLPSEPEEFTIIRKDGKHILVEIRSFPIEIDGQPLMLGCVRDITARKAAESERQERHQRIQKLHAAVLRLATHPAMVAGDRPMPDAKRGRGPEPGPRGRLAAESFERRVDLRGRIPPRGWPAQRG
jgi:PAS domain S-box-containing protein